MAEAAAPAEAGAARDAAERRYLLALFWDAALGFGRRGSGLVAWTLTLAIIVLAFSGLGLQYRLNVFPRLAEWSGSARRFASLRPRWN